MKTTSSRNTILLITLALALPACGQEVSSTTQSTSSSSSSSSGEGGQGGQGGAGGQGGQGGIGGQGGAGGQGGIGGQGGAGGAPLCDKPMNNPCFECIYDSCNIDYCDCANNIACPNIIPCSAQCPAMDEACRMNCYQKNSIGFAEFLLIANCAGTTCKPSCQNAEPIPPCQLCLATQCEQELEACFGNPECTLFIDCIKACPPGDMQCTTKCTNDHPAGTNQATQLRTCSINNCTNVCN